MPDRIQQGMLNTLFLGRLMVHLGGFGDAPEFQTIDGANMINTEEAYYDGNGQGAIIGGTVRRSPRTGPRPCSVRGA